MHFLFLPRWPLALLLLLLSIFIFIRDRKSKANVAFSLVCFSASVWLLFYSIAAFCTSISEAYFWYRIGYIGVIFIAIAHFHFTTTFLKISSLNWLITLNYFVGFIMFFLLYYTRLLIDGLHTYPWGYYPKAGVLHPAFLSFFMGLVNAASGQTIYAFIKSWKTAPQAHLQQLKYILLAFSIFAFASMDFIPNYGFNIFPLGYIPASLFLIIIFYSIVRYRLMDISIVITRTGIFVAVYSVVLGIPFAIAFGLQEFLFKFFAENWWIIPLVCSTVLATVGPFVYLFIQKKTEDKLFKEQRRYQATLRQASYGMGRVKDLKRLVNLIVHIVSRTVGLQHTIIYLNDPISKRYLLGAYKSKDIRFQPLKRVDYDSALVEYLLEKKVPIVYEEIRQITANYGEKGLARLEKELKEFSAEVLVPSFVDEKLLAIIMLGKKLNQRNYTDDDLSVFSILANQAALAIENAQFYEDIKKTHEQLFRAEKMATIGTMADGLSHQINNRFHALGFIAGDALDSIKIKKDLATTTELKELFVDVEHALTRIQENVGQGGEIVQGLLKYTRKGEQGFHPIDLDKLITASVEMTQFKIKPGELMIVREYPADLPKIKGNFTQLQEVFFNMIDNAYDAMMQRRHELKEPGFKATIKISASDHDGFIDILLEDNGIGIKEEDKEKLFTPFFTTKVSSQVGKKGTGLGLYVIQKLIEEYHNGKVRYESVYKRGTKAFLHLPKFEGKD